MAISDPTTEKQFTVKSSDSLVFKITKFTDGVLSIKQMIHIDKDEAMLIPKLSNMNGETLIKVITFLSNQAGVNLSIEEKKKFEEKFLCREEAMRMCELMKASRELGLTDLYDIVKRSISNAIKNKSGKYVRK